MSKQLAVAAAVSVLTMALFAISTGIASPPAHLKNEKGAAIRIATPFISVRLPEFTVPAFLR